MLATIVNIQPKDSAGGGGETRETIVHRLASEMEEKLPPDYIPFEVGFEAKVNVILLIHSNILYYMKLLLLQIADLNIPENSWNVLSRWTG